MGNPGYLYLVYKETAHGEWVKVGTASGMVRVRDHRDWNLRFQTLNGEKLENPYSSEKLILEHFPETNRRNPNCDICGVPKPSVGRTGVDGYTEIRHLQCYPGLLDYFKRIRITFLIMEICSYDFFSTRYRK